IMTRNGGGAWAQTIYWPLQQASKYGRGTALRPIVDSPVYDCSDYTGVPLLDATATLGDDGSLTIFAVNRDLKEDIELKADLRAFGKLKLGEHLLLHHDDVKAVNTEDKPDNVAPVKGRHGKLDGGHFTIRVPALSWNVIRLEKAD
ncbi:MAG TPA: alpha-L-arabinofuranosidase C-terminal domain-containing protein, partial [Clostridia bacterium]|nr:alpha-L-arabinofuranosidase C-terminal domain-containing protein [Clostridia bacterium]